MLNLVSPEETKQAWQVMKERRYEHALKIYDEFVARDNGKFFYGNRGVVHLALGNWEEARAHFQQARTQIGGKIPMPLVGAALWLNGETEAACQDWADDIARRRSGEITNADEADGVETPALLWWASLRPDCSHWRPLAIDELKRRCRTKQCQRSSWPGPAAGFLLGKIDTEPLEAATQDFRPFRGKERTQAHFYLGAARLAEGDQAGYHERLREALEQGEDSIIAAEYHLARRELGLI